MTDVSQMSDAELLSHLAMPALTQQESGGNGAAVSPKGALGSTQMLPQTAQAMAQKLGVPFRQDLLTATTPEAIDYQQQLGRAYLQQGIEATGNLEDGLHYYHGGPDRRQWGPKGAAYASSVMGRLGQGGDAPAAASEAPAAAPDVSQMSDADLIAALKPTSPKPVVEAEVLGHPEFGVGAAYKTPPAASAQPDAGGAATAAASQAAAPTVAEDALSGLAQPWNTLKKDAVQGYQDVAAGKALNPFYIPRIAGDALGMAGSGVEAVVRPAARAINSLMPAPSKFTWDPKAPFRQLQGDDAQNFVEGELNTALSAGAPETPIDRAAVLKPMSLDELRAAKSSAYDTLDGMGVTYAPNAQAKLADQIGYDLAGMKINPKVTPKAHAMMEDVLGELRSGKPLSLSDMDQMRQSVERATGKADDAEKFFGAQIKGALDNFMETAGPTETLNGDPRAASDALANARDLNRRYRKVQAVQNEVESAKLRASSTYAGGNQANAIRQELRPLIDPTSSQQLRGLDPAETQAIKGVVQGSGPANAWRLVGKTLDPRGLLGAAVQSAMGLSTHGASAATVPLGMMATERSKSATLGAVDDLLNLLSTGAAPPPLPPKIPMLTLAGKPGIPILSPAGLTGAGVVAAPLARIPSARSDRTVGTSAIGARRHR